MKRKNLNYIIRNMKKEEIDFAIELAFNEGWNPGLYDGEVFYNTDPNGFLVGELDGKLISCISVVSYNDDFGFLGFYIVKPKYRGKGYGLKIWNEGLKYLGNRNIGLDGVLAQQDNYKKSGFSLAYSNIRYEGKFNKDIYLGEKSRNIVNLSFISFESLLKYDLKLFPVPREEFLKGWINLKDSFAFGFVEKDMLKGYGVIRKCRKGYKIGPLFADNCEIAEALFCKMVQNAQGDFVYFDPPQVNNKAVEIAQKYKMTKVFETARMYTKSEPDIDLNRIFGVTTFELG